MIYIIIGVIFLILALILLLILFIPFHISLYLKKQGKDSGGYFQVKWLRIRLLKRDIPGEEEEKEEEEKKERKRSIDDIIDVLKKSMDAFKYLTPIFRAFLKSLELEKLSLNLNLGFSSPVTTAQVCGYLWSIIPLLNLQPPINLSVTPDFKERKFDATFDFELKLTLYRIVGAILKAFTKKPVRELFSSVRKLNQ